MASSGLTRRSPGRRVTLPSPPGDISQPPAGRRTVKIIRLRFNGFHAVTCGAASIALEVGLE